MTVRAVTELLFEQLHSRIQSKHQPPRVVLRQETLRKFLRESGVPSYLRADLSTLEKLDKAVSRLNDKQPAKMAEIIVTIADPRLHLDFPEYHEGLIKFLNLRLKFDGYVLRKEGEFYPLRPLERENLAISGLQSRLGSSDYQSVQDELERALAAVDSDPADAVTAACSMVESVCKSILDQMGKPYPSRQEVSRLSSEITKHLDLSPAGDDINNDMKRMLSGLASIATGIGALRTHAGDAHGRGLTSIQIEPVAARLAINTAATLAAFYIEAWSLQQSR